MCVKCSRCGGKFHCKHNMIIQDGHPITPKDVTECPINFYYVANCVWCPV